MLTILKKVWPYAALVIGLLMLTSIVTFFEDVPENPQEISIDKLVHTKPADLPKWVKVSDGKLLWSRSYVLYREDDKGDAKTKEAILVPLVNEKIMNGWNNVSDIPSPKNCCVVELPWEEFKKRFPAICSAVENDKLLDAEFSSMEVSFCPELEDENFVFGRKKTVYQSYRDLGFEQIVGVTPDSEPMSKGGAAGVFIFGLVLIGVGGWQLKKRKSEKANSFSPEGGAAQGIAGAVQNVLRQGPEETPRNPDEET